MQVDRFRDQVLSIGHLYLTLHKHKVEFVWRIQNMFKDKQLPKIIMRMEVIAIKRSIDIL
jgi:hypothetical protein